MKHSYCEHQTTADLVFGMLQKADPSGGPVRFFARSRKLQRVTGWVCHSRRDLALAMHWARTNEGEWDAYVQLNPSRGRTGTRAKAAEVTYWSWFTMDIDPVSPVHNPLLALDRADAIMRGNLGLVDPVHRAVIYSGRGMQAWYPLRPAPLLTEIGSPLLVPVRQDPLVWPDQEPYDLNSMLTTGITSLPLSVVAPRAMAYWLDNFRQRLGPEGVFEGCTIDVSCSDLPRVMRLPGTVNWKTGRETELLEVPEGTNGGMAHKLVTYAPYRLWKEPEQPTGLGDVNETTPWTYFLPFLTRAARMFITEGAEEGGRHRAAAATLLSLKELGCGREQCQKALLFGASLCRPEPLHAREITPMIERHYGRKHGCQGGHHQGSFQA